MARFIFVIAFLITWSFLTISAIPPFELRDVGSLEFKTNNINNYFPNDLNDHLSKDLNYRLPNDTKPIAYKIFISTDVFRNNFEFSGTVQISINVSKNTNEITLHQRSLKLISWELVGQDGQPMIISKTHYDSITEFFTFTTADTLEQGSNVFLTIQYTGTLRNDSAGFYRSSYTDKNGKTIWIATTQFEPTDARHGFPCYDEPALKATFDISIEHDSRNIAISNMPQADKQVSGSRTITRFKKTPLTSTYLIAFIVSDFKFIEKFDKNGLRHRVFAKPTKIETAQFAIDESDVVLNAISDFVKINYTLPKMDQTAIPNFAAGAMENWGQVTYQEDNLLYNPSEHSEGRKKTIITIVAHEFGHQWFGNLVSPVWWNYLWLNEGFATLIENIATDLVHPEWKTFDVFVTRRLQRSLKIDASSTRNTRPMTYYTENPKGIAALFDDVAYTKSGSVLRMFLHALSEGSFRKGINSYLNDKAFSVADEVDLFEHLDAAAKEDKTLDKKLNVKDLFESWSNQAGFPLLTVERNYNQSSIKLSQERYFDKYPHSEANMTSWWIPYSFDTANNFVVDKTFPDGWLPKGIKSKLIKPKGNKTWTNDDWVLFNKQQTGFYRVLYDQQNYRLIMNELNSGDMNKIHPLSRAQLLDDLNDFVLTKRIPSAMYFDLVKYLKRETEFAPWSTAEQFFLKMKSALLKGSEAYKKYREFVIDIIEPFYREYITLVKTEKKSYIEMIKQQIAITLACEFNIESCLQATKQSLKDSLQRRHFSSNNMRGIIYKYGIRDADENIVDSVWNRLNSIENNEERQEILSSFGNIANDTLMQKYLMKSVDPEITLNKDDRVALFTGIATKSQEGLSQALSLLKNKFEKCCFFKDELEIGCKYVKELKKTLVDLAKNINSDIVKHQFEAILMRMTKQEVLSEQEIKQITNTIEETMQATTSNRRVVEEYISSLP